MDIVYAHVYAYVSARTCMHSSARGGARARDVDRRLRVHVGNLNAICNCMPTLGAVQWHRPRCYIRAGEQSLKCACMVYMCACVCASSRLVSLFVFPFYAKSIASIRFDTPGFIICPGVRMADIDWPLRTDGIAKSNPSSSLRKEEEDDEDEANGFECANLASKSSSLSGVLSSRPPRPNRFNLVLNDDTDGILPFFIFLSAIINRCTTSSELCCWPSARVDFESSTPPVALVAAAVAPVGDTIGVIAFLSTPRLEARFLEADEPPSREHSMQEEECLPRH